MEYMFEAGFLGTRAPFFMDSTTLIVALLPLLVGFAITAARRSSYRLHALLQTVIFIISFIVIGYFEYGIRLGGGFERFALQSSLSPLLLKTLLVVHIAIATLTLLLWTWILLRALISYKQARLPGHDSLKHKILGKRVFLGIIFTTLSGIGVYITLFIL